MSESISIRTLETSFNLPIHPRQIQQWRGAFIQMAGWEDDLFHNHIKPQTYHYRYPLIQYRIQRGQAGILAINEGVEAFQKVLANTDWKVQWEGNKHNLLIDQLKMDEGPLQVLPTSKEYTLHKYLAFNQENYGHWLNCQGMIERITLLERMIVGHILCFSEAMGYRLPKRLEVRLQNINNTRKLEYKTARIAFDLEFSANISLPFGIGLGKGVSHGYGQCRPIQIRRPRVRQLSKDQEKTKVV